MFLTIAQITCKHIENWGQKLFGETEITHNPFAFNNHLLWEKAIGYLETYIQQEVEQIIQGRQNLIYTNREELPFKRIDDTLEYTLQEIMKQLENDLNMPLTQMDQAYITCKFYNDVEQEILEQATEKVFMTKRSHLALTQYMFSKRLKGLLEEGQEVTLNELQEMYNAYTGTGLWKYYYQS